MAIGSCCRVPGPVRLAADAPPQRGRPHLCSLRRGLHCGGAGVAAPGGRCVADPVGCGGRGHCAGGDGNYCVATDPFLAVATQHFAVTMPQANDRSVLHTALGSFVAANFMEK